MGERKKERKRYREKEDKGRKNDDGGVRNDKRREK
jgi:hypothetical protein